MTPTASKPKIAIVVHLYYDDLWPELANYIRNVPPPFTLYVTIPTASIAEAMVARSFPKAKIVRAPNVGRDLLPFLRLLPELQSFDAVCKIHSKRHEAWRRELLDSILKTRDRTKVIVQAFVNDPSLGMVGSAALFLDGNSQTIRLTRARMEQLLGSVPPRFGFFAGTIFWVRPAFVAGLAETFPDSAFVEHGDDDGQPEHVVERLFGAEMLRDGRRIGLAARDAMQTVPGMTQGRRDDFRAVLARLG
jgi:lipopolysaccharide biosynthesis protein